MIAQLSIARPGFLIALMLLAALIPQLPPVFYRSEFHINIAFVFFALLIIAVWARFLPLKNIAIVALYFLVLQLLLLLSYVVGSEGMSSLGELPSLLRPAFLFIITTAFAILLSHKNSFGACIQASKILIVISFFYACLEVFAFDSVAGLIHAIYRLPDKKNIDGVSVSFFTLPYYAAYVHSILMLFILAALSVRVSIVNIVIFSMAVINIILTQSKTGIFVVFVTIFLFWFISVSFKWKVIVATIAMVVLCCVVFFLYDFVKYLNDSIGGNFAYTTMLILEKPDEAGNLAERNNQAADTFHLLSMSGWLIGIGLGKGVLIESWVAYIPYRYGMLGFVFFILFYLLISVRAFFQAAILESREDILKSRVLGIWSLCIFFTQLSSLSMEMSKASIYTCLMLAMASGSLLKRKVK